MAGVPTTAISRPLAEKLPGPFKGVLQNENKPSQYDPDAPPQFRVVHAVRISNDGLVYVCDRTNDRIQVFKKDGSFVKEGIIARHTFGCGSSWDIAFSPDPAQRYLIMPDGTNERAWIVDRQSLKIVGQFGGGGHWAGQFYGAHNIAADSHGNVFITESYEGKRVQKFAFGGFTEPATQPEDP
jgi:hypothetical protein